MIRVLLCYARSGGTLFSKFTASQKNVIFLSEVNPNHNAVGSPASQVNQWYGWEEDENKDFETQVASIYKRCKKEGKDLVIRDFSFIDFTPHFLNNYNPVGAFSILHTLKQFGEIKTTSFVRNALDVWISRGCPPNFFEGYLGFAKALRGLNINVLKYEDFCQNPKNVFQKLMIYWDVYNWDFDEKAINYSKVTGDNLMKTPSRGRAFKSIINFDRKPIALSLIKAANKNKELMAANSFLGYVDDLSFPNQSYLEQFKLEIKHRIKVILGRYPADIF